MSPLGIQRTVAVIIIASPWIFIPGVFKDIVLLIAGVFLFMSTLDLKKKPKVIYEDRNDESATAASPVLAA